ncbi:hypothetical protein [Saccharomonospora cyanea]|nr:hypothetical protein [Saccharomonospora cyanea]
MKKSEPVRLTEHDSYLWASLDEQPPVTDAVKKIVQTYRELHQV